MNFRRKRIRGQNQKVRRTWLAGDYRIVWRREAYGIRLPARYQATVRIVLPCGSMWDFVGRKLYKTLKAAQEACEYHERQWTKAAGSSSVRALKQTLGRIPCGIPIWARSKMSRKLQEIILNPLTRGSDDDEPPPAPAEPDCPQPAQPDVPPVETGRRRKAAHALKARRRGCGRRDR